MALGWFFIVPGGFSWFFHCSRLVFLGSRLVFHGSWLVFHGFPWFFMVFHVFSWFFMVFHGSGLAFYGFFMVPGWFFMVFHGFSWFFMVPGAKRGMRHIELPNLS